MDLSPTTIATLPLARPWFDDEETQRSLGGPDWLERAFELATGPLEALGSDVTGRFLWLVTDGTESVGLVDLERYTNGTAGFAFVVESLWQILPS